MGSDYTLTHMIITAILLLLFEKTNDYVRFHGEYRLSITALTIRKSDHDHVLLSLSIGATHDTPNPHVVIHDRAQLLGMVPVRVKLVSSRSDHGLPFVLHRQTHFCHLFDRPDSLRRLSCIQRPNINGFKWLQQQSKLDRELRLSAKVLPPCHRRSSGKMGRRRVDQGVDIIDGPAPWQDNTGCISLMACSPVLGGVLYHLYRCIILFYASC